GTAYRSYDNRIRRTTIIISQALGEWGSVALNGGRDEYRDKVKQDYIGASYSNSWKGITFAVNWSRNNNIGDYYSNSLRTENNLNLWMSIP
ncbi:fimbria/pilus outer membrane usher protein, partial [Escherichia coli]|nr:fimbria/pilus outer membrane usher protein [Escherichia coli]